MAPRGLQVAPSVFWLRILIQRKPFTFVPALPQSLSPWAGRTGLDVSGVGVCSLGGWRSGSTPRFITP